MNKITSGLTEAVSFSLGFTASSICLLSFMESKSNSRILPQNLASPYHCLWPNVIKWFKLTAVHEFSGSGSASYLWVPWFSDLSCLHWSTAGLWGRCPVRRGLCGRQHGAATPSGENQRDRGVQTALLPVSAFPV